jgi:hypothetical protein
MHIVATERSGASRCGRAHVTIHRSQEALDVEIQLVGDIHRSSAPQLEFPTAEHQSCQAAFDSHSFDSLRMDAVPRGHVGALRHRHASSRARHPMAKMKQIAKALGCDHGLADALWRTGVHEARMLASMVDEPERVTPAQMDRWDRKSRLLSRSRCCVRSAEASPRRLVGNQRASPGTVRPTWSSSPPRSWRISCRSLPIGFIRQDARPDASRRRASHSHATCR